MYCERNEKILETPNQGIGVIRLMDSPGALLLPNGEEPAGVGIAAGGPVLTLRWNPCYFSVFPLDPVDWHGQGEMLPKCVVWAAGGWRSHSTNQDRDHQKKAVWTRRMRDRASTSYNFSP